MTPFERLLTFHLEGCSERGLDYQTRTTLFLQQNHLLHRIGGWPAQQRLWQMVERQALLLHTSGLVEQQRIRQLMEQYRDLPMDLADASLVAAAEVLGLRQVFTLDSDFHIYRLPRNEAFEVVP